MAGRRPARGGMGETPGGFRESRGCRLLGLGLGLIVLDVRLCLHVRLVDFGFLGRGFGVGRRGSWSCKKANCHERCNEMLGHTACLLCRPVLRRTQPIGASAFRGRGPSIKSCSFNPARRAGMKGEGWYSPR